MASMRWWSLTLMLVGLLIMMQQMMSVQANDNDAGNKDNPVESTTSENQTCLPCDQGDAEASSSGCCLATTDGDNDNNNTKIGRESTAAKVRIANQIFEKFLQTSLDNILTRELAPESPSSKKQSLQATHGDGIATETFRPVLQGHYTLVRPTPLDDDKINVIISSPTVAQTLFGHLLTGENTTTTMAANDVVQYSTDLLAWASGQILNQEKDENNNDQTTSWSTPYALAMSGRRYTFQCPYQTGDSYGDGRVITLGQVLVPQTQNDGLQQHRWEIQVKGGGPTPFSRGADGRATLRSALREFLMGQALTHLGIDTTQTLAVLTPDSAASACTTTRYWWSRVFSSYPPSVSDARMAHYSEQVKDEIFAQYLNATATINLDDDAATKKMLNNEMERQAITEPCGVAIRVAPNILRIGQLDVFARRAFLKRSCRKCDFTFTPSTTWNQTSTAWKELEQLILYAARRQAELDHDDEDITVDWKFLNDEQTKSDDDKYFIAAATSLLTSVGLRLARSMANVIRVGLAHGSYNADNCLLSGHLLDYGTAAFMDEFDSSFAKWIGTGQHLGFLNTPLAALSNFKILAEAIAPPIAIRQSQKDDDSSSLNDKTKSLVHSLYSQAVETMQQELDGMYRTKFGFSKTRKDVDDLLDKVELIWNDVRADYTLFFRQLTRVAFAFPEYNNNKKKKNNKSSSTNYIGMLKMLTGNDNPDHNPFYKTTLRPADNIKLLNWIKEWRRLLALENEQDLIAERMRLANPKYILREWMVSQAYSTAGDGDLRLLEELHQLIQNPYDEGTPEQESSWYRKSPTEFLPLAYDLP